MAVAKLINEPEQERQFSFEVLPPLKGTGTDGLFRDIEKLCELNPAFINITTHHSEYVYRELPGGHFERLRLRRRPGTIAVAAAIQQRFQVTVQPHVICSGCTIEDIEYELLDLQFLGITDLLLLRGDKAKDDRTFQPTYPEKHEEAPNIESDMRWLLEKQRLGAQYAVTQLFFDNEKYFSFVERARQMGITMPIIPGIKPLAKLNQLSVVPRTFHCDIPEPLAREIVKCKTDDDARQLGIEWTTDQCRDLYRHGVNDIHFYTVGAVDSVAEIAHRLL